MTAASNWQSRDFNGCRFDMSFVRLDGRAIEIRSIRPLTERTRVFKFTFIAYPKPSHRGYGEIDGAYATVFVNDPVAESAEAAARELVEEALWDIEELDTWAPVRDGEYAPTSPWYGYYAQALRDGICAVFNTWPVGASDADEP